MPRPRSVDLPTLRDALAARDSATALELAAVLGISRSSVARLLAELGEEVVRLGAARNARYCLRREVFGIGHRWPVRRVTERGDLQSFATLEAVRGGFRLTPVPSILRKDYPDGYFSGIPFIFADARPQGFLGRAQARQAANRIGLPPDPRNWTAEHTLAYLVTFGDDLPGELVVGDEMSSHIEQGSTGAMTNSLAAAIPAADRKSQYPSLADRVMLGETVGSSAGGEQPKFVTWIIDEGDIPRAVIVKFSTTTNTAAGRRWADLLQAEAIALGVLHESGVSAPSVEVIDTPLRRFLEVTRYDRIGPHGRRGVISLGSVEAGMISGTVNNWVDAATALESQGLLDAASATQLRRLWCFGNLIGNNDMHFGNVSLWWTDEGRFSLAPIYDMLPMVFAPTQGELVRRSFELPEHRPELNNDWEVATGWALKFWSRIMDDASISKEFLALAEATHDRVRAFQSYPSLTSPRPRPPALAERYPLIARSLRAQQVGSPQPRDLNTRRELHAEISSLLASGDDTRQLIEGLFPQGITPANFAEFTTNAYYYFGADDEVRTFMGKAWADILRGWNDDQRREFLFLVIEDSHNIFSALDFAVEVFRQIQFPAATALRWFRTARAQLGNDLYQRGFWGCLEAFASHTPTEAVAVATQWLEASPSDTERSVIARLIGIARLHLHQGDTGKAESEALDNRLRQGGHPEWRALFLESWFRLASDKQLTEEKALRLRDELAVQGQQELSSWCFLLSVIVRADPLSWHWAHREISALASPKLDGASRFNLFIAATSAWEMADPPNEISRSQWEDVVFALLPFGEDEVGLWNRLEYFLREIGQNEPARLVPFINRLVQVADEALRKKLENHEKGFIDVLRDTGVPTEVATHLCLGPSGNGRRIGLIIFARASVDRLDAQALLAATPKQLELLLCEGQHLILDSAALGRLHATLAPHFDRMPPALTEAFYGEVQYQVKNSHGYQEALKSAGSEHPRLVAILAESEAFFQKLHETGESPALQVEVPGYRRAEQAFLRKLSRDITRSSDEQSIFLRSAKKVQLLYSRNWRLLSSTGELSPPSPLKKHSHSVEMPRMEFLDPEGQHHRRINAIARVNELEASL